jgi:hypothetical protein
MQKPASSVEIEWAGCVWRGVIVGGLGVFTTDKGSTYAGGVTDGVFDGRAVINWSDGATFYCELAAGVEHGYREAHWADGAVRYYLHERGKTVHSARVYADARCAFDGKYSCGTDHAGLVALKASAQQATVRCHPARAARARVHFCVRACVGRRCDLCVYLRVRLCARVNVMMTTMMITLMMVR